MIRKAGIQAATLLLAALIPAVLSALLHPKRPAWNHPNAIPEVSVATASGWGQAVLWIDARSQTEYEKAHIPSAMLLNEENWDSLLSAVLDVWQPGVRIVVYCNSQSCHSSQEVAKRLREEVDLADVYVLRGGWDSWLSSTKK